MKTFIIAVILTVGIFVQPQIAPPGDRGQVTANAQAAASINVDRVDSRVLASAEMQALQGAGVLECHEELSSSGDWYVSCCADLWLFRLCVEVNWSAIQRVLPL
jgi:hypothetical protein